MPRVTHRQYLIGHFYAGKLKGGSNIKTAMLETQDKFGKRGTSRRTIYRLCKKMGLKITITNGTTFHDENGTK